MDLKQFGLDVDRGLLPGFVDTPWRTWQKQYLFPCLSCMSADDARQIECIRRLSESLRPFEYRRNPNTNCSYHIVGPEDIFDIMAFFC